MSRLRIVLADDHPMFRAGIKKVLEEMPEVEVIAEASDGLELLRLLKVTTPDLLILDISMPNLRGIEATREVKSSHPRLKVLILTMHKDKEYLFHAMNAGASGYLLKEDADSELFTAIKEIRAGRNYISPILSRELAGDFVRSSQEQRSVLEDPLSHREREVLKLIAEGKPSREIADALFISPRTVEHHRAHIMKKLNLRTVAELIRYAISKGYTS